MTNWHGEVRYMLSTSLCRLLFGRKKLLCFTVASMITLLLALSLLWLAAASSSQQQQQQQNSSRKHHFLLQKSRLLQHSVSPPSLTIRPGKKVTFKCRVKGVYSVTQWLDIGFYMLIKKNTVMPLSSGTPGISIRTSAVEGRPGSRYRRTITRLTLHPEMYDILEYGDNYFCCKGFLEGNSSIPVQRFVNYFIVRKKKPKRRNAKR